MAGKRIERVGSSAVTRENHVAERGAPAPGNMRRVLGDIGNLVDARAARCYVSKDGGLHPVKKQDVATRGEKQRRQIALSRSGTTTAKVEAKTKVVSQERVVIYRNSSADCEGGIPLLVSIGDRPRVKPLVRSGRGAAVKKVPTLTATLTARSEAIGRYGTEMVETESEHHVHDIDKGDANNQLCVVDYVGDIYSFYRKTEVQSCVAPDYMCRQKDINHKMRAILIDWLIEVHLKFGLMPETLFLTTNLLDRYLSVENVSKKTLQLVGVTAMLLAAKYEEIIAPEVQTIVFITDDAYTRQEVLAMEKSMLNTLHFNLTVPTPYVFIVRFLKAASADKQIELLAYFFVELCLTEYVAIKYSPSLLAAAAVYTAHHTLQKAPFWSATLSRHSEYGELQLRDCARLMVGLHLKGAEAKLLVVHKKYSSSKFQSVASLTPADLNFWDTESDGRSIVSNSN